MTGGVCAAIGNIPARARTPAYGGDGQVRGGAWVAELTGLLDLSSWPEGMRVIVRKERPHLGAQLPPPFALDDRVVRRQRGGLRRSGPGYRGRR
jgi:hypothetical protein